VLAWAASVALPGASFAFFLSSFAAGAASFFFLSGLAALLASSGLPVLDGLYSSLGGGFSGSGNFSSRSFL